MMTHKTILLASLLTSASLVSGCGMLKKKQPEPAPSAALVAPPTALTAVPTTPTPEPEATLADDAISTPQDFEDDAFAKVTDKTYKSEIEGLKKEIEAK